MISSDVRASEPKLNVEFGLNMKFLRDKSSTETELDLKNEKID